MRHLLVSLGALALVGAGAPTLSFAADDPIVAVVNGDKVMRSEVEAAHAALPDQYRQMPIEAIYDPLLSRVIDSHLLEQQAIKENIEKRPDVQEALARARVQVLRQEVLEVAVQEGSTDARLHQAYDAMKTQPGFAFEEVHAEHILLKTKDEADAVIADLSKGADFATLAKEKSIDPSAKQNGGDLGYFSAGTMVKEFADAAFAIPVGTIGKDPVQSQFGWHVIKVVDKREHIPTFQEKEQEVRQEVAKEIVTALLEQVRTGAKIERFNLDGTPVEAAPAAPAGAAPAAPAPATTAPKAD
jgi:peptidyl-prolyl cis-trans isomerase C